MARWSRFDSIHDQIGFGLGKSNTYWNLIELTDKSSQKRIDAIIVSYAPTSQAITPASITVGRVIVVEGALSIDGANVSSNFLDPYNQNLSAHAVLSGGVIRADVLLNGAGPHNVLQSSGQIYTRGPNGLFVFQLPAYINTDILGQPSGVIGALTVIGEENVKNDTRRTTDPRRYG